MRPRTVLFALTNTHHGFFKGAARYAREHNWHVVADMIYTAKIPVGWRGDGILSFIGYREDLAQFILSSGLPTVEISMLRSDLHLPCVEGDSNLIGRLAADHFLERGYRHYAWAPLMDDLLNAERHRGFADRLAKEGFTCHQLPPADTRRGDPAKHDWIARRRVLKEKLLRLPKPLAVFSYNDCVAADIIDVCSAASLPVPEAVAVMGVDNDYILCECVRVPISSVCHDLEGMAYHAAALLDRLMSGKKPPKEVLRVPPTGVVTRRSTDIVAVDNLQVARAVRYIGDHYSNPLLGVGDIVAAVGMSRRELERTFRKELNRTPNEEILRVRMEVAKRLLSTTNLKAVEIAAKTGFGWANHFYRTFRKLIGTSPKIYRRRQKLKLQTLGARRDRKPTSTRLPK